MPANFTSGWFGNNEAAWHGQGIVTQGTLPAGEAFQAANALFPIEKRELLSRRSEGFVCGDSLAYIAEPSGVYEIFRTDTQKLLGVVSKDYEIIENKALLRMAEFIREEVDMDSVIVLSNGSKVCFTATLRHATKEVLPGDTVKRRLVGWLGHDGKTGCGAMFTTVRVVCENTFVIAQKENSAKVSIIHKKGANENFDNLISSINVARESFNQEVETMKALSEISINQDVFKEYLERVYDQDIPKGKSIYDLRKYPSIKRAYHFGLGSEMGAGTLWNALNAVTQVETSPKVGTAKQRNATFTKANFGSGIDRSRKAVSIATKMLDQLV